MKTAREIIAGSLPARTDEPDVWAEVILRKLAAEGYQIVPPGGIHEPTREAAAKVALSQRLSDSAVADQAYADGDRPKMLDAMSCAGTAILIAAAIRALRATHG